MRKTSLIAFEGIDGVGKTTIARIVTEKLGAIYIKTPFKLLKFFERLLISRTRNQELEALGYFCLAILTSLFIRAMLYFNNVICDKYILVTIVDQTVLGSKWITALSKFRYILVKKPDFTFCLTVSNENKMLERLNAKLNLDDNDIQMAPLWQNIQAEYRKYEEIIEIDTTNLSIGDTIKIVFQNINQ